MNIQHPTSNAQQRRLRPFCRRATSQSRKPRIQAYRRLAEVSTQEQLDALRKTWRDRFGPLPPAAENLLTTAEIKLAAAARKITVVEAKEGKLMFTRGGDYILIGGKFPRLTADNPDARLKEILAMVSSL